ncbi:MAG TPA: sigma 54-interacting transcriptional regulator [Solidesulfovibrio magneticus]|nr:sigma 54-interacting transcriptional regulator [Solidesulfovibrio magneticus]
MTPDAPWLAEALGQSDAFLACMEAVAQAAAIDRPALIVGERGTGKELAAARLHYHSPRWDRPYVPVNLAALPRTLIESELFGHEAGAFTGAARRRAGRFEAADGGTLFLDELHAAPPAVQAKLLRAVEYGLIERIGSSQPVTVDARIVAAVNVDPRRLVARGRLLPDLLDRLAFCVLVMPPLRERHGDIPYLAERFAARFAAQLGRPEPPTFSQAALTTLAAHSWPGNIRELKTVVERAVLASPTPLIDTVTLDPFAALSPAREVQEGVTPPWPPEACSSSPHSPHVPHALPPHPGSSGGMIPPDGSRAAPWPPEASPSSPLPNFTEAVASLEIALLARALARSGGNQRRAAGLLGLGYHQFRGLYRKYAGALDAAPKAP